MNRPTRATDNDLAMLDAAIGRRVAEARASRKLSQTALGRAIGVSFQQVHNYESGANRLGFSRLCAIAKTLDYRLIDLIGDLDAPDSSLSETHDQLSVAGARNLLAAYAALPLAVRQALLQLLVEIAKHWALDPDGTGATGIALIAATPGDRAALQAMARYAAYERSVATEEEPGWAFAEDGTTRAPDLGPYFEAPGSHPYMIRVRGELAGFVIVAGGQAAKFTLAEFFVHHRFKAIDVAAQIAAACFRRYKGLWEVAAAPADADGWRSVIAQFTAGGFTEARRRLRRREQIVFRFPTDTNRAT